MKDLKSREEMISGYHIYEKEKRSSVNELFRVTGKTGLIVPLVYTSRRYSH